MGGSGISSRLLVLQQTETVLLKNAFDTSKTSSKQSAPRLESEASTVCCHTETASPINHSSHSECCSGNKRLGGLFSHFVNVTTTNSCFVPASSSAWVWRSPLHNFQSLPWLGPVNCYCLLKRWTNTPSLQLSHWRRRWKSEPIQQISRSVETNWESVWMDTLLSDSDTSLRSARKWGLNAFTYRPDKVRNTFNDPFQWCFTKKK